MLAYRKYVTIQDPQKLVLTDLPFGAGQRVEIVVIGEDETVAKRVHELRELFRATQALPQARALTEQDIATEIETYRAQR
ncbi:MAG: hypothetical protein HY741_12390 [Chloroflexi bacterium]|nr:hypothetical protein [Chloroflexota bacterium]